MKLLTLALAMVLAIPVSAQDINPTEVKAVMQKVADWQIEHYNDS